MLTQCDFGSDVESEIDGPELNTNGPRRERDREREADMSSWGEFFFGDTVLERYREGRAALTRLRGEMEAVSRGGGAGGGSENGGPGTGTGAGAGGGGV